MKKTLLTMVLGVATLVGSAQLVEVQSTVKVPVDASLMIDIPRVSPDGTFAIVSNLADRSLSRVDLTTGAATRVVESGMALHLQFTPEGDNIVYQNSTNRGRLRYYSVETVELSSGMHRTMAAPARHGARFTVSNEGVLSLNADGRFSAQRLRGAKPAAEPRAVVSIHYGHLEVTMPDGTVNVLDPQGKGSYLFPSLSPDGTKIVYYKSYEGCFVCDLDGSNVRALGYVHAPRWINNELIVGQQDYDDGEYLTSSSIVVANLDGQMQTIVPAEMMALNPSASADGRTIAFSTAAGELYVITLK